MNDMAAEWVIPEWTFADCLRKARQIAGMSQRDFAEQLGVKAGAYAQWEADNNRPRDVVAIAKRIEMLTRIPASWTLGLELQRPRPGGPGGVVESRLGESNPRPFHYKSAIRPISLDTHRSRHTAASPARRAS